MSEKLNIWISILITALIFWVFVTKSDSINRMLDKDYMFVNRAYNCNNYPMQKY